MFHLQGRIEDKIKVGLNTKSTETAGDNWVSTTGIWIVQTFCCIWANKVLHLSFNAVLHLRFGSHTQNTSFNIIHILRGSFIMAHLLWRVGWKWNSKCGEIPGLFALWQLFQNNWGYLYLAVKVALLIFIISRKVPQNHISRHYHVKWLENSQWWESLPA